MVKILIIIGESGVGKDTLLKELINNKIIDEGIISTTSRPMRNGEKEGREYYFISTEEFKNKINNNEFIEQRIYNTVNGDWYYGVSKNNNVDFNSKKTYGVILDYNGYVEYSKWLKENHRFDCRFENIFLYAPLQERLRRSITREGTMTDKQCLEVCRRMIKDNEEIGIHIDDCNHVLISDDEHKEYNLKYIKELLEEV